MAVDNVGDQIITKFHEGHYSCLGTSKSLDLGRAAPEHSSKQVHCLLELPRLIYALRNYSSDGVIDARESAKLKVQVNQLHRMVPYLGEHIHARLQWGVLQCMLDVQLYLRVTKEACV